MQPVPIRPENKDRYPANWQDIRQAILKREGNCCKWCRVPNGVTNPRTGSKVVLTIAHLDHVPEHCQPDNLAALCQQCHNAYDAPVRARNRAARKREELKTMGQMELGIDGV